MSCEGVRCSITYGEVKSFAADVTIISARKVRINVRTGEEEPDTAQDVLPADLDPALKQSIANSLRRFVHHQDKCDVGCYCASHGRVEERTATFVFQMIPLHREQKAKVWVDLGERNSNEVKERVISGQEKAIDEDTGQPYDFDLDHDSVGDTLVNCCGDLVLEMTIVNTYRYTLSVRAKVKLVTEAGECKRVPGLGGAMV